MKHVTIDHRIVIKIGTSTLTAGKKELYLPIIVDLARQIAYLHEISKEVILVTSGAIAAGRELMHKSESTRQIPAKQIYVISALKRNSYFTVSC